MPFNKILTLVIVGVIIIIVVFSIYNLQNKKVVTGAEGMVGLIGEVKDSLSPRGEVFIRGEFWTAESSEGIIPEGSRVEVLKVKDSSLLVRRYKG